MKHRACLVVGAVLIGICVGAAPPCFGNPQDWTVVTLDSEGNAGKYAELQLGPDGRLHIVYLRSDNSTLKIITREGGIWGTPHTIDDSGAVTGHCAVAPMLGGDLPVSYRRSSSGELWYAGPQLARQWSTARITTETDDVGRGLSMVRQGAGDLALAFRNQTAGSLLHMRREGGSWTPIEVVDPGPSRGQYADLAYRAGVGYAFSEYGGNGGFLAYADPEIAPRAWAVQAVTTESDDVGRGLSMVRQGAGDLALAFRNQTDGSLLHLRREGESWTPIEVVDPGPGRGQYSDLAYRAGVGYAFSEYVANGGFLAYADPEIEARAWAVQPVTSESDDVGRGLSMVRQGAGDLALAFRNQTDGSLLHMRREGGSWTPIEVVDPGPSRGQSADLAYRSGAGYAFSEYAGDVGSLFFADPEIEPRPWGVLALDHHDDVGRQLSMIRGPEGRLDYTYLGFDQNSGWHIRAGEYLPGSARIIRTVVDSVAVLGTEHIRPDIYLTPGENWFVSFRNGVDHHLYCGMIESLHIIPADVSDPELGPEPDASTADAGPIETRLIGAQPNPAAGQLRIFYTAAAAGPAELRVMDPTGRVVRRMEASAVQGHNFFDLDAAAGPRELPAGVYFVRLRVGEKWLAARRLVLTP